ncbi:MAG: hypothetical protein IKM59_04050 [Oscillospiraceae bacterium]|nr:hypothetical protein [Oscillospiraceae bacterium]
MKSELDLDGDGGGLLGKRDTNPEQDSKALFRKFDDEDSFADDKKLDTKLIQFWADRGGKSGYAKIDKRWDHPHIDPSSPFFRDMITTESTGNWNPDADGFVRDNDGFVRRVIDKYSDPNKPMTRLCPDCHNPLPLPDYGKYPVIFISVVGVTGAGKTVYLNQLLTRFSDAMEGTGYRVAANNLGEIGESVCAERPLPESTDEKIMRRPLAVTLMRDNPGRRESKGLSIVFYDIAGENCVNTRGEADALQAKSTIGKFIAFCDGLIFLIDPEQLPPFAVGAAVRPSNINQVVDVMSQIRAEMNPQKPDWADIPVAVTIAKSDKLRSCATIPGNNVLFTYPDENIKGFAREENLGIDAFLRDLLSRTANTQVAPLNTFVRRSFFAISAITCGVESRFKKYQNMYILDEENDSKFQDLRRWVKGWNERSEENRKYYRSCPIVTKDGQAISFPVEESIHPDNASKIITEIRADSVDSDSIYLTLWDVATEINLTGYPMSDPAPRRVEDPLKWIMWKLLLMGPKFVPEIPRARKTFELRRTYEQYLLEHQAYNARKCKEFYGEPL